MSTHKKIIAKMVDAMETTNDVFEATWIVANDVREEITAKAGPVAGENAFMVTVNVLASAVANGLIVCADEDLTA